MHVISARRVLLGIKTVWYVYLDTTNPSITNTYIVEQTIVFLCVPVWKCRFPKTSLRKGG